MRMSKKKRLNNKGFSLVEIIIAIAIMAILTGALAPQLIQYIDQTRKSADVDNAQKIATAVSVALANEAAYHVAGTKNLSDCYGASPNAFDTAIKNVLKGTTAAKPKYKTTAYDDFRIVIDGDKNFKIYAVKSSDLSGTVVDANELYPVVGSNFTN